MKKADESVNSGKKKPIMCWFAGLFLSVLDFLAGAVMEPLYSHVDNYNISLVINRLFSEENYTFYLHPWLCRMLGFFSKCFPKADVFTVLLHILVIFALAMLFGTILQLKASKYKKLSLVFAVFTISLAVNVWNTDFTVQAALLNLAGSALLLKSAKEDCYGLIIPGSMLVCFGFMWRKEGAMLTVPFILLDVFVQVMNGADGKKTIKKFLHIWATPVLCVAVLLSTQMVTQNSTRYKQGVDYCYARAMVEDMPVKPWEEIPEELKTGEITESEYNAAVLWLLIDTDRIDTRLFNEAARIGSVNRYPFSFPGVIGAAKEMFFVINALKIWTGPLGLMLLVSFSAILLAGKGGWKTIECILAFLGGGAILLYFTLRGRAVVHIWASVIMSMEYVFLLSFAETDEKPEPGCKTGAVKAPAVILTVVCLAGLTLTAYKSNLHTPQFAVNSRTDNDGVLSGFEYGDDDLYIWDRWHREITEPYMAAGKLPTKDFIDHNMPAGDWFYGQNYFNDYLTDHSAGNPAAALLERKHTYLVAENCTDIFSYLQEHFGSDIAVTKVAEINGIPVWQFVK